MIFGSGDGGAAVSLALLGASLVEQRRMEEAVVEVQLARREVVLLGTAAADGGPSAAAVFWGKP